MRTRATRGGSKVVPLLYAKTHALPRLAYLHSNGKGWKTERGAIKNEGWNKGWGEVLIRATEGLQSKEVERKVRPGAHTVVMYFY